MKEIRKLICIGCPIGCQLEVAVEDGSILSVSGNTCARGDTYAREEVTNPTRIVTSTVRLLHSKTGAVTVPCKTRTPIPKNKIVACIKDIAGMSLPAPIPIGYVIKHDVAGTGVDMIATKDVL